VRQESTGDERYGTRTAFTANNITFNAFNLPFFYLSWKRLGVAFTVKTFIAIGLTSVLADVQSRFFSISSIHPAWAALAAESARPLPRGHAAPAAHSGKNAIRATSSSDRLKCRDSLRKR